MKKNTKEQKGIALVPLIIVITIIALVVVVATFVIINTITNAKNKPNTNKVNTSQETKADQKADIEKIKENKYSYLFGENKLFLTPPQTYTYRTFHYQ